MLLLKRYLKHPIMEKLSKACHPVNSDKEIVTRNKPGLYIKVKEGYKETKEDLWILFNMEGRFARPRKLINAVLFNYKCSVSVKYVFFYFIFKITYIHIYWQVY